VAKRRNILRLFDVYFSLDALVAQVLALAACAAALLSCSGSTDSKLVGGWNNSSLDPTACVTYSQITLISPTHGTNRSSQLRTRSRAGTLAGYTCAVTVINNLLLVVVWYR